MPVYTYLCYTCPQEILTLADRTKQDFLRKKANLEGNHRHQQLWWYQAPYIVETFLESGGFSGKTTVPFATSGGSGMGSTNKALAPSCKGAKLLEGKVFKLSASADALRTWAESCK